MKLFLLISLNTLFLISCFITASPKKGDGGEGENSQIESIRSQARTALGEIEAFQTEVKYIVSSLDSKNAENPISSNLSEKMEEIAALQKLAESYYEVVRSAETQVEGANTEEDVSKAVQTASSAKDEVVLARNRVEQILKNVKETLPEN